MGWGRSGERGAHLDNDSRAICRNSPRATGGPEWPHAQLLSAKINSSSAASSAAPGPDLKV